MFDQNSLLHLPFTQASTTTYEETDEFMDSNDFLESVEQADFQAQSSS